MGSKTNVFENDYLALILQGVSPTYLPTPGTGVYYISLFTVDPGESGGGTECNYTGYARAAIGRSAGAWTITGSNPTQAANTSPVSFAPCTGGSNNAVSFGLHSALTGGTMLYYGSLNTPIAIASGTQPIASAGAIVIQED